MAWQQYLDAEQARFVQELLTFVRIASASAKPENIPDVVRAAEWVAARLTAAGASFAVVAREVNRLADETGLRASRIVNVAAQLQTMLKQT